jgi:hypothetical protein
MNSVDLTQRKSITESVLSQIKISGPGLSVGKTGKKCIFYLSGAPTSVLANGMTFSVDGPTKPEVMCECKAKDGSFEYYFVAKLK